MNLLTIFDSLYQNHFFTKFLPVAIIFLIVLFSFLFFIGWKDKKKEKKKESLEEENTNKESLYFANKKEKKSDVTFEESFLTQNLKNFKKTLEEELQKEDVGGIELNPDGKDLVEILEEKRTPILDKEIIEDTVMSTILIDEEEELEIPKSKKNA